MGALARFAFEALASIPSLPGAGRRVATRVLLNQLRFTALEAVGLIVLLSGILSYLTIASAIAQLDKVGASELIGKLMVVAIVRQLGPLLTRHRNRGTERHRNHRRIGNQYRPR